MTSVKSVCTHNISSANFSQEKQMNAKYLHIQFVCLAGSAYDMQRDTHSHNTRFNGLIILNVATKKKTNSLKRSLCVSITDKIVSPSVRITSYIYELMYHSQNWSINNRKNLVNAKGYYIFLLYF